MTGGSCDGVVRPSLVYRLSQLSNLSPCHKTQVRQPVNSAYEYDKVGTLLETQQECTRCTCTNRTLLSRTVLVLVEIVRNPYITHKLTHPVTVSSHLWAKECASGKKRRASVNVCDCVSTQTAHKQHTNNRQSNAGASTRRLTRSCDVFLRYLHKWPVIVYDCAIGLRTPDYRAGCTR